MAVVKIESGVVVQTWRDVVTVADAVEKYGIDLGDLVEADHPPGMLYDGNTFTAPLILPSVPVPESSGRRALRALAATLGPAAVVVIEAEIGVRR